MEINIASFNHIGAQLFFFSQEESTKDNFPLAKRSTAVDHNCTIGVFGYEFETCLLNHD